MDDAYGLLKHDYDIIFCRNVLIYFDKATQERVIRKFISHLRPGGLLFLGHSESIMGMEFPCVKSNPPSTNLPRDNASGNTRFSPGRLCHIGPALISTVLGSCVSVCLIDKKTGVGGLNHFLLPGIPSDEANNLNRGLTSTATLIRSMLNRNATIDSLEAKIFGGCNSLYQNDIFKLVNEILRSR